LIDYILKNKEWIFSGIGVSTIALLFIIFKYFIHHKTPLTNKDKPKGTNVQSDSVIQSGDIPQNQVYRIIKEIEEMPPLQLDSIRKHYIGLNVDWLTEYYSAYKAENGLIKVYLTLITESFRPINVNCEVNFSEYKQFSIVKRGTKIKIIGEISKFEDYSFWIKNAKLFFQ